MVPGGTLVSNSMTRELSPTVGDSPDMGLGRGLESVSYINTSRFSCLIRIPATAIGNRMDPKRGHMEFISFYEGPA
jgi:hypothetical protein